MHSSKKLIILFLVILSISSIIFILLNARKNQTPILPSTLTGAEYENLTPSVSTLQDVYDKLGNPIKQRQEGDTKIIEYKSSNPNFNNEFFINSEKLSFVKQIVTLNESINISKINEKYGNYSNILYGPLSSNGFHLYISPEKGIAYLGHQEANIILEIWYFPPTDFENFKKLYASDYSEKYNPIQ